MILRFSGLEHPIRITAGRPAVVEVSNKILFSRMCISLHSELGEEAPEPFSIWSDEGKELNPAKCCLMIESPIILPWADRKLIGNLQSCFEQMMLENETSRLDIEQTAKQLEYSVERLGFQVEGDYSFALEWDLRQFLKAFRFGPEYDLSDPLIDNLIKFLDFTADVMAGQLLVFFNLKNFLGIKDLERFYERVFFREMPVLLMESTRDPNEYEPEIKLAIDQDFLETVK